MHRIIKSKKIITSNVSYPKVDVHKQNEETERWMRANPKRVKCLPDGVSTYKYPKRLY